MTALPPSDRIRLFADAVLEQIDQDTGGATYRMEVNGAETALLIPVSVWEALGRPPRLLMTLEPTDEHQHEPPGSIRVDDLSDEATDALLADIRDVGGVPAGTLCMCGKESVPAGNTFVLVDGIRHRFGAACYRDVSRHGQ